MMTTFIYILIYIIGCVFAFGRLTAIHQEALTDYEMPVPWWKDGASGIGGIIMIIGLSWWFVITTMVIFPKPFLRFSYKKLIREWRHREAEKQVKDWSENIKWEDAPKNK